MVGKSKPLSLPQMESGFCTDPKETSLQCRNSNKDSLKYKTKLVNC